MRSTSHIHKKPTFHSIRLFPAAAIMTLMMFSFAAGQSNQCSLHLTELAPAPELLNFHLGMTKEQVKVRVPQVVFGKTDEFGVSKTTINPFFDPTIDKSTFQDVRSISLDFLDDKLISLWIGFENTFNAPTVDDFAKRISQSLHLPDAWASWRSRGQQMRCADFQLTVTMVGGGPSFRVLNTSADDAVAARRQAKEVQDSATTEGTGEPPDIVGDKKNKIYYPVGCQPSKQIVEADRVTFKNSEAADKAGFKPARNCVE